MMIKICGQSTEITLNVCGREMTFDENNLVAILEDYFLNINVNKTAYVQPPVEGEWFEVRPSTIDKSLFIQERDDEKQEETRKLIIKAFDELNGNAARYSKNFKTMQPKKVWNRMTSFEDLEVLAGKIGHHNANWVEQALEWAQRIQNGETWKAICNDDDTAKWRRAIIWSKRYGRIVGGNCFTKVSATNIDKNEYDFQSQGFYDVIPLVVSYN